MIPPPPLSDVTALILAGGRATRLGGVDKGLLTVAGRPLIEHVLAALAPQVATVLISANRNLDRYRRYGHRVLPDADADFHGPLAGIQQGLAHCATPWLLTCPCDAPLVPPDYAGRMRGAVDGARAAVAHDGVRQQHLFCLLAGELEADLAAALGRGERAAHRWLEALEPVSVDFSARPEALFNLNTEADRRRLETRLEARHER